MMKNLQQTFLTLAAGVLIPLPALAVIVIRSPQTSREEFKNYIQTEQAQPYSNILLGDIKKKNKKNMEPLLFLLGQAQKSFLKSHLKTAGEYFQSIVKMADQHDWPEEARKIIFYSYLRLAQIEWQGENAEIFLHSALVFDSTMQPEPSLFPPPLLKKLEKLKKTMPQTVLYLKHIFPFHEVILINGKEFSSQKKLKLPYGSYRVTALSSSHKTWSQKIALTQLIQKKVVTPSLVSGSCESPVVPRSLMEYQILFPDFCWWSRPLNGSSKRLKKNKIAGNQEEILKPPSFLKRNARWIALGAGAAAAGAWLFHSANKDSKTSKKNENKKSAPKSKEKTKRKPTIQIGF